MSKSRVIATGAASLALCIVIWNFAQDEGRQLRQPVFTVSRECQEYPVEEELSRIGELFYGPCHAFPDEPAGYYCQCIRPFSWIPVVAAERGVLLSAAEEESLGPLRDQCSLGRCCMGNLADNSWRASKCSNMYQFVERFEIEGGRHLFHSSHIVNMLPSGSRIMFYGDSVTGQVYDGFLCDLARHGASFGTETEMVRESEPDILTLTRVNVSLPGGRVSTIGWYRQHKTRSRGYSIKEVCAISDIVVMNYGLWYHSKSEIKDSVQNHIAPFVKRHCIDRGVHVIFRGSSSTHFKRPSGKFEPQKLESEEEKSWYFKEFGKRYDANEDMHPYDGCVALRHVNYRRDYNWRERTFAKEFKRNGLTLRLPPWHLTLSSIDCRSPSEDSEKVLDFIPFGEVTAELHRYHHEECTHYCSSPLLWAPLWDAMYLLLAVRQPKCSQLLNGKNLDAATPLFDPSITFKPVVVTNQFYIPEFLNNPLKYSIETYNSTK